MNSEINNKCIIKRIFKYNINKTALKNLIKNLFIKNIL